MCGGGGSFQSLCAGYDSSLSSSSFLLFPNFTFSTKNKIIHVSQALAQLYVSKCDFARSRLWMCSRNSIQFLCLISNLFLNLNNIGAIKFQFFGFIRTERSLTLTRVVGYSGPRSYGVARGTSQGPTVAV